jgi:hypothetical protein
MVLNIATTIVSSEEASHTPGIVFSANIHPQDIKSHGPKYKTIIALSMEGFREDIAPGPSLISSGCSFCALPVSTSWLLGADSTEIGGSSDDIVDLAAPKTAGNNGVLSSTGCELRSSPAFVHSECFDMAPIVVLYDFLLRGRLMKGRSEMRHERPY